MGKLHGPLREKCRQSVGAVTARKSDDAPQAVAGVSKVPPKLRCLGVVFPEDDAVVIEQQLHRLRWVSVAVGRLAARLPRHRMWDVVLVASRLGVLKVPVF